MPLFWSLVAVPFLIVLNAFFVSAEYALVAIRPAQIDLMRQGRFRPAASAMARLKAAPTSAIGAIQVCITMTNLMLGWIGEPAMSAVLHHAFGSMIELAPAVMTTVATVLSFLVVTLLTVVFSELLPKAMTLRYVVFAAAVTSVPVLLIKNIVQPLVWVMNAMANAVTTPLGLGRVDEIEHENITVGELRVMATQARTQGVLTGRAQDLVLNSLALADRRAKDIMVPRTSVAFLDLRRSMVENRQVINEYLYTRLPLCDGGMDHVIGVVPTKIFLSAYNAEGDTQVLSLIAQPPVFAPENLSLDRLLNVFNEHHTQMIFLVDEYGGVEGIVTLQDVVDELVGEIGEPGRAPEIATPGRGGEVTVAGDTPLYEIARMLGLPGWPAGHGEVTIGGLITSELRRIPTGGEELTVDGVRMRVREADGRVVRSVVLRRIPEADAGGSQGSSSDSGT